MAFEDLKTRHASMWGSGPYEEITKTIADMHAVLVDSLCPQPGERWLDLATGTGAVARLAARQGADVTGQDLAPVLIQTARELAEAEGVALRFEVNDAEDLPYEDASFDVVSSSCGIMFAPDHEAVARGLALVCRPGGRLGLTTWLPTGGVGDFFRVMARFQPPPQPGVGDPFDWGRQEHVVELIGDAFELEFEVLDSPYEPESGEAAWQLFSTAYGPTKTLADSLEPERREEFHRAFVDYLEGFRSEGGIRQSREYLLTLGRRR